MAVTLSADTKDALARDVPQAQHCRDALLAGLSLYGRDTRSRAFVTKRNAVARLFRQLSPQSKAVGRSTSYRVELPPQYVGTPPKATHKCDRVMEARAAFLACGSVSAARSGYHLELVVADEARAARLRWTLRAIGTAPKAMRRKSRTVLYYKDAETIGDVLTLIGAHAAVLRLQNLRAVKETKNRIHRLVNTEAANLDRSAAAAAGHRRMIETVVSAYGMKRLTPPLREIARVRLAHPDETLAELGRRCNPPIGKATVNSRLGALARLAHAMRGESVTAARRG